MKNRLIVTHELVKNVNYDKYFDIYLKTFLAFHDMQKNNLKKIRINISFLK